MQTPADGKIDLLNCFKDISFDVTCLLLVFKDLVILLYYSLLHTSLERFCETLSSVEVYLFLISLFSFPFPQIKPFNPNDFKS